MRELKEVETWFLSARRTYDDKSRGRERHTVAVAQTIHALFRANDALTVRLLNRRSTRHDDAAKLFSDLVRYNNIDPKYAGFRELAIKAVSEKSKYDYKGTEVSAKVAARWINDTERFISAVKEIIQRGK
ncbi:MAG: hypothetical protein V3U52_02695 [Thermoplasmata archaeon]